MKNSNFLLSESRKLGICFGVLASSLLFVSMTSVAEEVRPAESNKFELNGFPAVRQELLNLIGIASKRVWLVSDFLSDGEIVASLYMAMYRKLDVVVLLGRKRAHKYMSRLYDLKKQGIPVYLKPDNYPIKFPTAILADERLCLVDGELDFLAKYSSYRLQFAKGQLIDQFVNSFSEAAKLAIAAVPRPMPLVGRPMSRHKSSRGNLDTLTSLPDYSGEADGSFNYDLVKKYQRSAPQGMSRKLPKETIYQANSKRKIVKPAPPPAPELPPEELGGEPQGNGRDQSQSSVDEGSQL